MKDNASYQNQEGVEDTLTRPARRYELDWLRVLVIINLIPFHAAWMMTSVLQSFIFLFFMLVFLL